MSQSKIYFENIYTMDSVGWQTEVLEYVTQIQFVYHSSLPKLLLNCVTVCFSHFNHGSNGLPSDCFERKYFDRKWRGRKNLGLSTLIICVCKNHTYSIVGMENEIDLHVKKKLRQEIVQLSNRFKIFFY